MRGGELAICIAANEALLRLLLRHKGAKEALDVGVNALRAQKSGALACGCAAAHLIGDHNLQPILASKVTVQRGLERR